MSLMRRHNHHTNSDDESETISSTAAPPPLAAEEEGAEVIEVSTAKGVDNDDDVANWGGETSEDDEKGSVSVNDVDIADLTAEELRDFQEEYPEYAGAAEGFIMTRGLKSMIKDFVEKRKKGRKLNEAKKELTQQIKALEAYEEKIQRGKKKFSGFKKSTRQANEAQKISNERIKQKISGELATKRKLREQLKLISNKDYTDNKDGIRDEAEKSLKNTLPVIVGEPLKIASVIIAEAAALLSGSGDEDDEDADGEELAEQFNERLDLGAEKEGSDAHSESSSASSAGKFESTYADLQPARPRRATKKRVIKFGESAPANSIDPLTTMLGEKRAPAATMVVNVSKGEIVMSAKTPRDSDDGEPETEPERNVTTLSSENTWSSGSWFSSNVQDVIASTVFSIGHAREPQKLARVLSRAMCAALHDMALADPSNDAIAQVFKISTHAALHAAPGDVQHSMDGVAKRSAPEGRVIPALSRHMRAASSSRNHPNMGVGERVPHVNAYADGNALMNVAAVLNTATLALAATGASEECERLVESTSSFLASATGRRGGKKKAAVKKTIAADGSESKQLSRLEYL